MKTVTLICDNEDSCPDATTHKYPDVGEKVTVWSPTDVRELGTDEELVEFLPGQWATVLNIHPEFHEVIVQHGPHKVWLCIDDVDGLDNSDPSILGPNDEHPELDER